MTHDAVLFISFGGPEKSEDIMPFLEIVTRGRGISKERLLDVAHHYEAIGGKSPINEITRRQASALERELRAQGSELRVYLGQRNWHPFLDETLKKMAADGVLHAVGFITAAHRCEASYERYTTAVDSVIRRIGESAPLIDYVGPWFDHPLFIDAIVERIRETDSPDHRITESPVVTCIFTAHSIPVPMAEASSYVQELETTAHLVCQKLGRKEWKLAYSSRSGRPEDPWLEPDVRDAVRQEASRGAKEVFLVPIGFVADHVEVLFDLDVEAAEAARQAGVRLRRAQTVGDHPLFIRMIADLIRRRAREPVSGAPAIL